MTEVHVQHVPFERKLENLHHRAEKTLQSLRDSYKLRYIELARFPADLAALEASIRRLLLVDTHRCPQCRKSLERLDRVITEMQRKYRSLLSSLFPVIPAALSLQRSGREIMRESRQAAPTRPETISARLGEKRRANDRSRSRSRSAPKPKRPQVREDLVYIDYASENIFPI